MAEIRRDEQPVDTGISTATLANMNNRQPNQINGRPAVEPERQPSTAAMAAAGTPKTANEPEQDSPLFSPEETKELHSRWDAIQVGFVDEPRQAVEKADSLVAGAMKRLAEGFAEERAKLEKQWDSGDSVSTEDLRVALRRYRTFFGRLLKV